MNKINQQTTTLIELWTKSTSITRHLDASLGSIHGIGYTEYLVLHHLAQSPNLVLRRIDLANLLGRSASGVTKMLLPMEKIGLVARETNPRDARVSLVKITTTGLKIYQQASASINQTAENMFKRLQTTEIKGLQNLLISISD